MKWLQRISFKVPFFIFVATLGSVGIRFYLDQSHQESMAKVFETDFINSLDQTSSRLSIALALDEVSEAEELLRTLTYQHNIEIAALFDAKNGLLLFSANSFEAQSHKNAVVERILKRIRLRTSNSLEANYQKWQQNGNDFIIRPLPVARTGTSLTPNKMALLFVQRPTGGVKNHLLSSYQENWRFGLLVIFIVGFLVTWFIQTSITARLDRLIANANSSTSGLIFEDESYRREDEIGELSRVLKHSFSSINQKNKELTIARHLQQVLTDCYRILATTKSLDELVSQVNTIHQNNDFFSDASLLVWRETNNDFHSLTNKQEINESDLPAPVLLSFQGQQSLLWTITSEKQRTRCIFEAKHADIRYGALELEIQQNTMDDKLQNLSTQLAAVCGSALAHIYDAEQLVLNQRSLGFREEEYKVLFGAIQDAVLICNQDGKILVANEMAEKLCAAKEGELIKRNIIELMPEDMAKIHPQYVERFIARTEKSNDGIQMPRQVQIRRFDHSSIDVEITLGHYLSSNKHLFVAVIRDVSERVIREKEIEFLANFDPLTKLPNRRQLTSVLQDALEISKRGQFSVGVALIDLDNFKHINDTYGHSMGDFLLCEVAERTSKVLRRHDCLVRFGGDEFILVLPTLPNAQDAMMTEAAKVLDRILEVLGAVFCHEQAKFKIGASIGIAFAPLDAKESELLLQYADSAMYLAKSEGKNTWRAYDTSLGERLARYNQLEKGLSLGLQRAEFEMFVQPQIRLSDNRVVAAEALIRWRQEDGSYLSPVEFIPVAEKTEKIIKIGQWMLEQALDFLQRHPELDSISVNVSPVQFKKINYAETVIRLVAESGIAPERLLLEITENLLLDPNDCNHLNTINLLSEHGIKLSIDDFGTGYSCLAYLHKLPIKELKIDRSFVSGFTMKTRKTSLVETFLGIAREFNLSVVAEGVETTEEADALRSMGCDLFQGYLASPAVPAAEFDQVVATWENLHVVEKN